MARVCIVLMCGIPGSGKTSVVKKLKDHFETPNQNSSSTQNCQEREDGSLAASSLPANSTACVHSLSYDEFITSQSDIIELNKESLWKSQRRKIHEAVAACLQMLLDVPECSQQEHAKTEEVQLDPTFQHNIQRYMDDFQCNLQTYRDHQYNLFIIDDNMYYKSMRYEFYQLARKYTTGFAHIYMNCPMEIAIQRNKSRDSVIPEHVIRAMSEKLEPPNRENTCEKRSLEVDALKSVNQNLGEMVRFILEAMHKPVEPYADDVDYEMRQESKVICSTSNMHQADQILRKLVAIEMTALKDKDVNKTDLQRMAKELNQRKSDIFKNLQCGKTLVPESYVNDCTDAAKDTSSPFYLFIQQLFTSNIC